MTETARPMTGRATRTEGEPRVELREERLVPHKEMEETGEVGLRKEVVSEQQSVDVPVTREEVFVERHAVEPRPADRPIGEDATIEVPVREVIEQEDEVVRRVVG